MTTGKLSPFSRLALFLTLIAVAVFATIAVAVSRPSLLIGLGPQSREAPDGSRMAVLEGRAVPVAGLFRPGAGEPPPAVLSRAELADLARQRPADVLLAEETDFVEEPDMLGSYAIFNRFMQRQGWLAGLLSGEHAGLVVAEADAASLTTMHVPVRPSRPVATLPSGFWIQLGSAICMLAVAAFLMTLRPRDGPSAAFAVSGAGAAGAALTAAIYSTRDLALEPRLFETLSALNQFCTFLFGVAAIHLFAMYPVRLARPRSLWPVGALSLVLFVLFRTQAVPIEFVSPHIGVLGLLIGILVFVALQYRATRADPANRAIMLWIGMSVVLGAGSFVLLITVPLLLGQEAATSQGAAFIPLAAIYAAIAVGLLRYRLFDLGRWAYRLMLYTVIIVGVLVLDLGIALALSLSPANSLGIAVLAIGLLYLACREYVFDRLLSERRRPELAGLYRETVGIAFQPSAEGKERSWIETVENHFNPLHCEIDPAPSVTRPQLLEDGIGMAIPAYDWSRGLKLRLAGGGKRLFDMRDIALVEQLADLVHSAETDRASYERGVSEERRRIAMDLHDDVAATLLSGLHAREEGQRRETITDALADIRQIASGLAGRELLLSQFIGHLRHASRNRAELHGFTLQWPLGGADECDVALPYAFHRNFSALHREALSNALKHGEPGLIEIETRLEGDTVVHSLGNRLAAPVPAGADEGERGLRHHGTGNMKTRAARLHGGIEAVEADGRFTVTLRLPLRANEAEPADGL